MRELITSFAFKADKGQPRPSRCSVEQIEYVSTIIEKNLKLLLNQPKNSPSQRAILRTIKNSLNSTWYEHSSEESKLNACKQINSFLEWLSRQSVLTIKLLSDYEKELLSVGSLKPQSLPTPLLHRFLKRGLKNISLSGQDYQFVYLVVESYSTPKTGNKNPQITLTSWFGRHPWLRDIIPEHYGKLESPKILIPSFQLTVACVLDIIMDARQELINVLRDNQLSMSRILGTPEEREKMSYRGTLSSWIPLVQNAFSLDEDHKPSTPLSLLLASDLFNSVQYNNTLTIIINEGLLKLEFEPYLEEYKARKQLFSTPYILSPDFDKQIDRFSKQLFSWLMATLMIQPAAIKNLSLDNYVEQKNKHGRTQTTQFRYYKPRSGKIYETPILNSRNYLSKVIIRYMELVKETNEHTFTYDSNTLRVSTLEDTLRNDNLCTLFLKIISSTIFKNKFNTKANTENISSIFHTAFTALLNNNYCRRIWVKQHPGKTNQDYPLEHPKPLVLSLFTNTHLKNSAVHSRTDLYRYEDLNNQNSHSSKVESLHYLSDANKDWVNQSGRIQRLVLNDVINTHYAIEYKSIYLKVDERKALTQFLSEEDPLEGSINNVGVYEPKAPNPDNNHSLIVVDTIETAVIMMHYIQQVSDKYQLLQKYRPDYLSNHVIILFEWMHYCLSKFRPATIKTAKKRLRSISAVLPELFLDLAQGGNTNA